MFDALSTGMSMGEEYIKHMRSVLRGTDDLEAPQRAGQHGDRAKWDVYATDMDDMNTMCNIYAILDLAAAHFTKYYHRTKSRCPIYDWDSDFQAHPSHLPNLSKLDQTCPNLSKLDPTPSTPTPHMCMSLRPTTCLSAPAKMASSGAQLWPTRRRRFSSG